MPVPWVTQALLCTALLSALFFSWLWQAFRLYSYPGLVPNDEAGNCSTCRCSWGLLACLRPPVAVPFCGTRAVPRIRPPRSWEHAFTAQACDAAADVDAGCVDGYAGFQRIFRMGIARQLGRQRSCRDRGRHRRLPIGLALCRFSGGQACPGPWPGDIVAPICNYLVLLCPEPYWVIPRVAFPALFALLPSVYPSASGGGRGAYLSLSRIPLFLVWMPAHCIQRKRLLQSVWALEPVMPGPSHAQSVLFSSCWEAVGVTGAGASHRSPIWYAFCSSSRYWSWAIPAWPLLHRESPSLSLGGLLFRVHLAEHLYDDGISARFRIARVRAGCSCWLAG